MTHLSGNCCSGGGCLNDGSIGGINRKSSGC